MTPYYSDDAVTIYHGDCREWMPEADVIVTDPPYGIGWGGETAGRAFRRKTGVRFGPIQGDDRPFDPTLLLELDKPTVLFGANHYADRLPPSPSWIVWDKRGHVASNDQADCELVWTNLGGPARLFKFVWVGGGSRRPDHPGRRSMTLHPNQKPLDLMRWIIQRCPAGVILDPYLGSGSTLVAAKSLNRRAIGIEIEERYCEVAARRCAQEVLGLSA